MRLLPESSPLGWTPFAWLVYLSFFVVYSAMTNDSAADWLLDGSIVLVFLVLYFRAFWLEGGPLLAIALAIVAIGLAAGLRNPGASCFVIYGAAFLGDVGPPSKGMRWLAAIVAVTALHSWMFTLSPTFWIPATVLSMLIGGANIHFCEMRRKDLALIRAHQRAEEYARVAERERIARDLHDLLGHTLSVIVLKSELAAKIASVDPARAVREIRDVEQISRKALSEVRQAIHGYRGERLADELASGRMALQAAGVAVEENLEVVPLSPDEERALALALREAVTNIVRHARARRCRIGLHRADGAIQLTIEDDGIGCGAVEGAGLAGMRSRLEAIGGTLGRDGSNGTRLSLRLPDRRPAGDMVVLP